MKRCIVIGAMAVGFDIKSLIKNTDFIFCADGGHLTCQKQNIIPDMIVGDFDSSKKPVNTNAVVVELPKEKNETDTYFIANLIVEKQFTDVLFCGVTGGRAEHTLANYQTLKYLSKHKINATIIDENSRYFLLTDGTVTISPIKNSYFSVLSIGDIAENVMIQGAKYPLNNYKMTDDYPIGISNEFLNEDVTISLTKGSVIIIVTEKD